MLVTCRQADHVVVPLLVCPFLLDLLGTYRVGDRCLHPSFSFRPVVQETKIYAPTIKKSGFAWNDSLKCIEVDSDEAWNTYVQNIFGKDRATGRGSATPTEMMNEPMHHIDVNDDDEEIEVDLDHSASLPRSNQQNSASSSSRHRKRNADTNIQKEMAKAFGEMISEFVDQLKTITNSLVKGSEPRPNIAAELAKMDLSINDQIKALRLILEKASDERTFLTLDGAMRKALVLLLHGAREL
ncbi:unnamed protein product [Prunus armeniaca]|uniref:Myb/SANT-like domain-containing protein n=1 Tax=Prunus armeniaca TaxID=36596 RepID=A0A6J5UTR6_PRUAR|nr:unnamed protein product [Prunus armeniaca]